MNNIKSSAIMAVTISIMGTLLLLSRNRKKRSRRCWVRSWIARRREKGIMNLVNNELLAEDPEAFKNYLRMTNESFIKLLSLVEPIISKQNTIMRECISSSDKLMITLRFLASGETYRNLMYSTRVHESTIAQFVPIVCRAIYEVLRENYMKVPQTTEEWEKIAADFHNLWQIPNTIGALDGKHIAFSAPISAGSLYYNYKGFNSVVLLALVDARYRFTYVDVGVNGRVSDGGVFTQSDLFKALEQNTLHIPKEKPLPERLKPIPYVIVADAAFPLKDYIMKPYPFRGLTEKQSIFNYRLSRARRVVENAFGILANRFRILLRTINLNAEKVKCITLACCALHNFLLEESHLYKASIEQPQTVTGTNTRKLGCQRSNRSSNQAIQIREEFTDYFNGPGAVSWQNKMIY